MPYQKGYHVCEGICHGFWVTVLSYINVYQLSMWWKLVRYHIEPYCGAYIIAASIVGSWSAIQAVIFKCSNFEYVSKIPCNAHPNATGKRLQFIVMHHALCNGKIFPKQRVKQRWNANNPRQNVRSRVKLWKSQKQQRSLDERKKKPPRIRELAIKPNCETSIVFSVYPTRFAKLHLAQCRITFICTRC